MNKLKTIGKFLAKQLNSIANIIIVISVLIVTYGAGGEHGFEKGVHGSIDVFTEAMKESCKDSKKLAVCTEIINDVLGYMNDKEQEFETADKLQSKIQSA
jgi:hypothetical protein